ncbi:MAG: UDP-N-acetylglucosamine 2-epimerase (non-hydrolyzing) [Agriterribacter sp.]
MKIAFIFGTRPEAIKLAPVIQYFQKDNSLNIDICITGQHKEMLKQVMDMFNLTPTTDLSLMQPNQTLASFTARAVDKLDVYFEESKPEAIFVQGDTSTVLAASLSAFYHKIKIFHIEAGLRTFDKYSPFPEEMNRKLTSVLADYHFSPTQISRQNLLKESVADDRIIVTGNTAIDALINISSRLETDKALKTLIDNSIPDIIKESNRIILVTGHRRENFGKGFEEICDAIKNLAQEFYDYLFVYPVHLNPNVQKFVLSNLSGIKNVQLLPPQNYVSFIYLMKKAYLILTDSGGIQEEAPSLQKPILVMRDTTERPEGIAAGCAKLVGPSKNHIVKAVQEILLNKNLYNNMIGIPNPYGDGNASAIIYNYFKDVM